MMHPCVIVYTCHLESDGLRSAVSKIGWSGEQPTGLYIFIPHDMIQGISFHPPDCQAVATSRICWHSYVTSELSPAVYPNKYSRFEIYHHHTALIASWNFLQSTIFNSIILPECPIIWASIYQAVRLLTFKSLETTRLDVIMIVLPWNLTSISGVVDVPVQF